MRAREEAWSKSANPELLLHPAPENKNVRGRCGRRNIAIPGGGLRADRELRADRRHQRRRPAVSDESLRSSICRSHFVFATDHTNLRTARSNSSRVKGLVT